VTRLYYTVLKRLVHLLAACLAFYISPLVVFQMSLLFVIVGRSEPLYEAELQKHKLSDAAIRQNYFVLHSSLDIVEERAWTNQNMYLRVVDKVRRILGLGN